MTLETRLRENPEGEPQEIKPEILTGEMATEILDFFGLDPHESQVHLLSKVDGRSWRRKSGSFFLLGITSPETPGFEVFGDSEPETRNCQRYFIGPKTLPAEVESHLEPEGKANLWVEVEVDPLKWIDQPLVKIVFAQKKQEGFGKTYLVRLYSKEDRDSSLVRIDEAQEEDCTAYSFLGETGGVILAPGIGPYQDGTLVVPLHLVLPDSSGRIYSQKKQFRKMLGLPR